MRIAKTQGGHFFSPGYLPLLKSRTFSEGQGNHNLAIGDVDADGKDEIVYGAMCLDDNGMPLYNTRLGHGDAIHLSDIDPERPGLEVFDIHERPRHQVGAEFRDVRHGSAHLGKTVA